MTKVLDLARLSRSVYDGTSPLGWKRTDFRAAWEGLLEDGLQAAVYRKSGEVVVAFRGTNISLRVIGAAQDLAADLVLGLGMNSAYYAAAEDFVNRTGALRANTVVTGHSLGGAVAQVIGNRMNLRFATFNAPGVAVWASRNMGSASKVAVAVRTVGAAASAVIHPVQAFKDITSAFGPVSGLNVRLDKDSVSKIGIHYGEIVTIKSAAAGNGPLENHSIDTVIQSIEGTSLADRDSDTFN